MPVELGPYSGSRASKVAKSGEPAVLGASDPDGKVFGVVQETSNDGLGFKKAYPAHKPELTITVTVRAPTVHHHILIAEKGAFNKKEALLQGAGTEDPMISGSQRMLNTGSGF